MGDAHSNGSGMIVFGDWNTELRKIRRMMGGWSNDQHDSDPYTGKQRHKLLDLIFYKDLPLQGQKPDRIDSSIHFSDHYSVIQTFALREVTSENTTDGGEVVDNSSRTTEDNSSSSAE